jgi:hypothetical protein
LGDLYPCEAFLSRVTVMYQAFRCALNYEPANPSSTATHTHCVTYI